MIANCGGEYEEKRLRGSKCECASVRVCAEKLTVDMIWIRDTFLNSVEAIVCCWATNTVSTIRGIHFKHNRSRRDHELVDKGKYQEYIPLQKTPSE